MPGFIGKIASGARRFASVFVALAIVGFFAPAISGATTKSSKHGAQKTQLPPIRIGGQGSLASLSGVATGFRARLATVNPTNGIDGRRIAFIGVLNDLSKSQTPQSAAKQLISSWHVTLVAPFATPNCTRATGQLFAKAKIPFVGWGVCSAFNNNRYGVGITGNAANPKFVSTAGLSQLKNSVTRHLVSKKSQGRQLTIAVVGDNTPNSIQSVKNQSAAARAVGFKVVYHANPIPQASPEYRTYAKTVMALKPSAIELLGTYAEDVDMAVYLNALGFSGPVSDNLTYRPGSISENQATRLTHVLTVSTVALAPNKQASEKKIARKLNKLGIRDVESLGVAIGYWSADMAIDLIKATAKRVGIAKVNAKSLETTLRDGWTYKNLMGSISFPDAFTKPMGCSTLLRNVEETYKLVAKFACHSTFAHVGK